MGYKVANDLVQHWVNVVDEQGREHVEARWMTTEVAYALTSHAA